MTESKKDKVLSEIFANDPQNILDISHDQSNKLIAEFMGAPTMIWNDPDPIKGNDYRVVLYQPYEDNETALIHYGVGELNSEAEVFISELEDISLKYHTSWDWLMPVVQRCTKVGYGNENDELTQIWEECFGDLDSGFLGNHIDEVYASVVKFIKWHNKNQA